MATPPNPKLGEILVRQKLISEEELACALSKQNRSSHPPKLGTLLVKNGSISAKQLEQTLVQQELPLGTLLVAKGLISPGMLERALAEQQLTGEKLGQILVYARAIAPEELEGLLREQYWRRGGYWIIDGARKARSHLGIVPSRPQRR